MKVLILECYYGESHKNWIQGVIKNCSYEFELIALPALNWKWRMQGGAISLAEKIQDLSYLPDLIITTSMTNVVVLKSLLPETFKNIPIHLYFHENQFSYHWSSKDKDPERKEHYYFIQYVSALASNKVFFNSRYNQDSFFEGCLKLLKIMPDMKNLDTIDKIKEKSAVLPLGLPLSEIENIWVKKEKLIEPLIVWNHRWEEEKNPKEFFFILRTLKKLGFSFKLCMLGENHPNNDHDFNDYREEFKSDILWWGMVHDYKEYISWLKKADISIVTSFQDFFGISILESIQCGVVTFLPNRLVYPEHFSKKSQEYLLYENQDDLIKKILNWKDVPIQNIKKEILKYDWKNQIPNYDKTIFSY